jgi:Polyketide cyclase / dehydrase and lipid transport
MTRVTSSSVIRAPTDAVWATIRDFNALPQWHPAVMSSEVEEGSAPDRVGCVRSVELVGGAKVRERLLALSDANHSVTFSILSSPMPVENLVSTLRLLPISDCGGTFIEWMAEFEVRPDHEAEMRRTISEDLHQAGFSALKQHLLG